MQTVLVESNAQDGVIIEQVSEVILPVAVVWQVVRLGREPACDLLVVGVIVLLLLIVVSLVTIAAAWRHQAKSRVNFSAGLKKNCTTATGCAVHLLRSCCLSAFADPSHLNHVLTKCITEAGCRSEAAQDAQEALTPTNGRAEALTSTGGQMSLARSVQGCARRPWSLPERD